MKNIIRLFLITAVIAPLVSCKDKSCYYYGQEYNSKTKQCECVQYLNSADAPALKHNDYNTCSAIFQNFYYASVDNRDFPYYSHTGDTIMCFGYVNKIWYAEEGEWAQFTFVDDTLSQFGQIWVESDSSLLQGVDLSAKCFVKGTLSFGHNTDHFTWIDSPAPGTCLSPTPLLNAVEIKN